MSLEDRFLYMSSICCCAEFHPHLEFWNLAKGLSLFPKMLWILPESAESLNCKCVTFFLPIVFVLNSFEQIWSFACLHGYTPHVVRRRPQSAWVWSNGCCEPCVSTGSWAHLSARPARLLTAEPILLSCVVYDQRLHCWCFLLCICNCLNIHSLLVILLIHFKLGHFSFLELE